MLDWLDRMLFKYLPIVGPILLLLLIGLALLVKRVLNWF
jgi:hypothetical protein